MWFEIFLFCTAFIAAFVQATTGFAYAIVLMALWPLFLSVPEATQLLMFGSVTVVGYIVVKYRKHINFKNVAIPLALGFIGNFIGVNALLSLDNMIIVKILGGLLVLLAIYFYIFSDRIHIPQNPFTASIAGALSGLMGGFFNISGPPIVLYYSVVAKDKEEYIATIQFYFVVLIVFKIFYLWWQRGLSNMVVSHIPLIVAASVGGMLLGLSVFKKLSAGVLKKAVYILMVISGLWYMIGS